VIDKQVKTTADAVAGVRDGSTVLVAGFGAVGSPTICSMHFTNKGPAN
jgi:3-oxoadipate CoA-transferase alpha subunit